MRTKLSVPVILFTLLLLSVGVAAQSPRKTDNIRLLTLAESSFSFGYHVTNKQGSSLDQYQTILAASEVIPQARSGLELQQSWFTFGYFQPVSYSSMLHFRIADRQRESFRVAPQLRLGISYRGGNLFSGYFQRQAVEQIDSLMNPVTGTYDFIDSVHRTNLAFRLQSEQILFDASMVFATNTDRVFSIYGGGGIAMGIPIMSYAHTSLYDGHYRVTRDAEGKEKRHPATVLLDLEETMKEGTYWVLMPYVPFGVSMRLSRSNPFLSQVSLFYEGRIGVHMRMLPEVPNVRLSTRHHTFGIKIRWK